MVKQYGIFLLLMATSAPAAIIGLPIVATAQGWVCSPAPSVTCPGNNGASPNNSYVAGNVQVLSSQFRDWFEFAIPNLPPGPFTTASLFLTESVTGHVGGPLTYAVYGLSGRPLAFNNVTTSNPFGSIATSTADNGRTVEIPLNADAFAAILAHQGGDIFFGGIDSGELSAIDSRDFSGPAIAAELIIIEGEQTVPEPNSTLLLATTLGTCGIVMRKRLCRR